MISEAKEAMELTCLQERWVSLLYNLLGMDEESVISHSFLQQINSAISNRVGSMDEELRERWERITENAAAIRSAHSGDLVYLEFGKTNEGEEETGGGLEDGQGEPEEEEDDLEPAMSQSSRRSRSTVKVEKVENPKGKKKEEGKTKKRKTHTEEKTFDGEVHKLKSEAVSLKLFAGLFTKSSSL